MLNNIALFYAVGAVVSSLFFIMTAKDVEAKFMDKPLPYSRVTGSSILGVLWPITLVLYVLSRPEEQ